MLLLSVKRAVDGLPTMFRSGVPFVEVYWSPSAQRVCLRGQYGIHKPGVRKPPEDGILVGVYDETAKKREVREDVFATIKALQ